MSRMKQQVKQSITF